MATAGDMITAAFLKVGVGSPTSAQTASALISLNNMMSLLGADLLTHVVISESFAVTAGDADYTIGKSTANWDTDRPVKVASCFLRDSEGYDHPLGVLSSKGYAGIGKKDYSARPTALYFLPEYPNARIIFNASPDAAYTAYLEFMKNFTEFAATSTTFSMPLEYKEALTYNLAISLGEDWDRVVPKTVQIKAMESREIIDRLNASNRPPAVAKFDFCNGGIYEIENDTLSGGSF